MKDPDPHLCSQNQNSVKTSPEDTTIDSGLYEQVYVRPDFDLK